MGATTSATLLAKLPELGTLDRKGIAALAGLAPHLKTLELAGMGMVVWQDRQIDAGEKWHPAIQDAMAEWEKAVNESVLGTKSPEEALTSAAERATKIMAGNKQKYQ